MGESWNQLVAEFTKSLEDALLANLSHRDPTIYRVFRMRDIGACIVSRGDAPVEGGDCVYGPDTFSACMKWMNDRLAGGLKSL